MAGLSLAYMYYLVPASLLLCILSLHILCQKYTLDDDTAAINNTSINSITSLSPPLLPSCSNGISEDLPWVDCIFQVRPLYDLNDKTNTTPSNNTATSVTFSTADVQLQKLYNHAEACEANNGKILELAPNFPVLVEGANYNQAVWLETQPMGGASYGVRNLRLALNNQLIFMRTQRRDGRLAGMVSQAVGAGIGVVHPTYSYPGNANRSMLQGFYMASPAVDVAWLMNQTISNTRSDAHHHNENQIRRYLQELSAVLQKFDGWLWRTRNSTRGVLWLNDTADTGEDGSDKYAAIGNDASHYNVTKPFESMDMMAYAYDAQKGLARIAKLLGDDSAHQHWTKRMGITAANLKARLWREEFGACFDRERADPIDNRGDDTSSGTFVTTLVHNNLRAMWSGIFSQQMADAFIDRHLMNTSEFWTPTPFPSIAVSDPRFQNKKGNNWSGPPEGLTFQRAIRALENYGHHAEVTLAGVLQRKALLKTMTFPQQIDPLTSTPESGDCYGPMILSMLEYLSLTTGIAVRPETNTILWSHVRVKEGSHQDHASVPQVNQAQRRQTSSINTDINNEPIAHRFNFTLQLGPTSFVLEGVETTYNNTSAKPSTHFSGKRNDKMIFECIGNARVVTALGGTVLSVVGVSSKVESVQLKVYTGLEDGNQKLQEYALIVAPNEEWALETGVPTLKRKIPFRMPYR